MPGRKSHEYVLYTAHWDSLGVDAARPGHNIFNGAVNNATGIAGLLALAQSFKRTIDPKPDRSIAFLATTAAQPDLLGSQYYVENPLLPLRQTLAVINIDMLINAGRSRDVSILGFGNSDLDDAARAEALLQGREAHPDPNPQFGLYFRSDSFSFAHRGVPVLYLQAGIDNAARGPVWGKAQIEDYFARRYPPTQRSIYRRLGCRRAGDRLDVGLPPRNSHRQQQTLSALVSEQRISRLAPSREPVFR